VCTSWLGGCFLGVLFFVWDVGLVLFGCCCSCGGFFSMLVVGCLERLYAYTLFELLCWWWIFGRMDVCFAIFKRIARWVCFRIHKPSKDSMNSTMQSGNSMAHLTAYSYTTSKPHNQPPPISNFTTQKGK
jgi:hypothetical protein